MTCSSLYNPVKRGKKRKKKHALLIFAKSKYVFKSPMYMSSTSPVFLRSRVTTSAILFKLKKKKRGGEWVSKWTGTRYFYPPEIMYSTDRNY